MTTPTTGAPPGDKLDAGVMKIASVVVLGAIMSILDTTVVSVALPTFQTVFDATYATVAWTMTGYTLALATVIPLTGWAADRFGTKRLYMMALTLFILGSIACGLAWNIGSLITFRVLQGLGGGMLMPLGMTIMTRAAGPARIGRVMAVLGVPMLLGPIAGPILGGWLIEVASWHWIFFINLPIGIIALITAWRVLEKDNPTPSEKFDFVGMLLLSPGLALFLYGVSSIPAEGTVASASVLIPAIVGVLLIAAFVFHALRKDHPLIDLHLFKRKQLSVSIITLSLFAIAFFGAMLLFPTYFISVRGETTLAAGLLLAPQGLGAMLTMPIAGRLTDKMGPGQVRARRYRVDRRRDGRFHPDHRHHVLRADPQLVVRDGHGHGHDDDADHDRRARVAESSAEVARGSTLMNIVQQSAASIGTAVMSVILTDQLLSKPAYQAGKAIQADPSQAANFPPQLLAEIPEPDGRGVRLHLLGGA